MRLPSGWPLLAFGLLVNIPSFADEVTFTAINHPAATATVVFGMNNQGTVAGSYLTGGGYQGFTLDQAGHFSPAGDRSGFSIYLSIRN